MTFSIAARAEYAVPYYTSSLYQSAKNGDAKAQYQLGYAYQHGRGVSPDTEEAIKWYRMAAEQGTTNAQSALALLYTEHKNYEEAYFWWSLEPSMTWPNFLQKVAVHLSKTQISALETRNRSWWKSRADSGDVSAYLALARSYTRSNKREEAVEWLRKAAAKGDAGAQFSLGQAYFDGNGIEKDYTAAEKWYRKAAEQSYFAAHERLGYLYKLVKHNDAEALKWYREAAERGYGAAQWALADMYAAGRGVKQDYEEAYFWALLSVTSKGFLLMDAGPEDYAKHLSEKQRSVVKVHASEWQKAHTNPVSKP